MKYFYEYKYLNGGKVGGHNLEKIVIDKNIVILKGVDILEKYFGSDYRCWEQIIDMNEIEYLKIEPMKEVEE